MSYRLVTQSVSGGESRPGSVSLEVRDTQGQAQVTLIQACESQLEFEQAVAALKKELDLQAAEAAQAFEAMRTGDEDIPRSPEEAWEKMKACSTEQEMFDLFNSLDPALRQQTGEFILTQASMFSGRGPVFAAHYDQSNHSLI